MQISAPIPLPGAMPAQPSTQASAGRLTRVMSLLAAIARSWYRERRTLTAFEQINADTLRDIGVSRWELQEHMRAEREELFRRLYQAGG